MTKQSKKELAQYWGCIADLAEYFDSRYLARVREKEDKKFPYKGKFTSLVKDMNRCGKKCGIKSIDVRDCWILLENTEEVVLWAVRTQARYRWSGLQKSKKQDLESFIKEVDQMGE